MRLGHQLRWQEIDPVGIHQLDDIIGEIDARDPGVVHVEPDRRLTDLKDRLQQTGGKIRRG